MCTLACSQDIPESAGELRNSIHALHWKITSVTMPTCDILLHHLQMLLYVHGYAFAYSYLSCTLGSAIDNCVAVWLGRTTTQCLDTCPL